MRKLLFGSGAKLHESAAGSTRFSECWNVGTDDTASCKLTLKHGQAKPL
jgi:hypothetical protein